MISVTKAGAALADLVSGRGRMAARLVQKGDAARDARQFRDAAVLYREAVALRPDWSALQVQAGHMFKEAGDHAQAEVHYLAALAAMPDDADLALQLGHFYKIIGRFADALRQYRRALALVSGWPEPIKELAALEQRGVLLPDADISLPEPAEGTAAILPDLLRGPAPVAPPVFDIIEMRRVSGRRERTRWGLLPMLTGVEALRGVCLSRSTLTDVEVLLDGEPFLQEPLRAFPSAVDGASKYVFNIWYDVSAVPTGRHHLEVRLIDADGIPRRWQADVMVSPPLDARDHPQSDALVVIDPLDLASVADQIRGRPSVVHNAADRIDPRPPENILLLRTDQLGDMVVSLPAVRRVREAFPGARIVALVTTANVDLARQCGLFDEVLVADFPDIMEARRRTMTHDEQLRLRDTLHGYRFDMAVDLALSAMSRPLLLLTGARRLFGFGDGDWPWLSAGVEGGTHDPKNYNEDAPQSSRILALVERVITLYNSYARIERRSDLSREQLVSLGVPADRRYAVLHTGARIVFSRWQGYPDLVARLLADSDLHVVLLADDPDVIARVAALPGAADRATTISRQLPFDQLDALLQFAAVFVGNDSGPKHLAALRGTPVVSVHSARINWREWGQEQTGVIVSRRVPCAGCTIYHDVEECGKDHACITDIRNDEVYEAVCSLVGAAELSSGAAGVGAADCCAAPTRLVVDRPG